MPGKTEKEKMLAGEPYFSNDPYLVRERDHALAQSRLYNSLGTGQRKEKLDILKSLLGSCPDDLELVPAFHCDYGYNIHLGHHFYANTNCVFLDCAEIRIGNYVFLGPNVQLYTATHPLDPALRRQGIEAARPITIEDDVWIGGNTVINAGITIGSGTTVGSGSVVTKDIPPHVLAAGNPCRVIRPLK